MARNIIEIIEKKIENIKSLTNYYEIMNIFKLKKDDDEVIIPEEEIIGDLLKKYNENVKNNFNSTYEKYKEAVKTLFSKEVEFIRQAQESLNRAYEQLKQGILDKDDYTAEIANLSMGLKELKPVAEKMLKKEINKKDDIKKQILEKAFETKKLDKDNILAKDFIKINLIKLCNIFCKDKEMEYYFSIEDEKQGLKDKVKENLKSCISILTNNSTSLPLTEEATKIIKREHNILKIKEFITKVVSTIEDNSNESGKIKVIEEITKLLQREFASKDKLTHLEEWQKDIVEELSKDEINREDLKKAIMYKGSYLSYVNIANGIVDKKYEDENNLKDALKSLALFINENELSAEESNKIVDNIVNLLALKGFLASQAPSLDYSIYGDKLLSFKNDFERLLNDNLKLNEREQLDILSFRNKDNIKDAIKIYSSSANKDNIRDYISNNVNTIIDNSNIYAKREFINNFSEFIFLKYSNVKFSPKKIIMFEENYKIIQLYLTNENYGGEIAKLDIKDIDKEYLKKLCNYYYSNSLSPSVFEIILVDDLEFLKSEKFKKFTNLFYSFINFTIDDIKKLDNSILQANRFFFIEFDFDKLLEEKNSDNLNNKSLNLSAKEINLYKKYKLLNEEMTLVDEALGEISKNSNISLEYKNCFSIVGIIPAYVREKDLYKIYNLNGYSNDALPKITDFNLIKKLRENKINFYTLSNESNPSIISGAYKEANTLKDIKFKIDDWFMRKYLQDYLEIELLNFWRNLRPNEKNYSDLVLEENKALNHLKLMLIDLSKREKIIYNWEINKWQKIEDKENIYFRVEVYIQYNRNIDGMQLFLFDVPIDYKN